MQVTDLRHFLDEKGAIGPKSGPGQKLANYVASIVALATDCVPKVAPPCMKCKSVELGIGFDDARKTIYWKCLSCNESGRITNWQKTLWDMSEDDVDHLM